MWEQISFYNEPPLKIHNTVRLIELFSGIGAQAKALQRLGVPFESWGAYDIDKYAVAAYNAIHGTNYAPTDITKLHAEDLGIVDRDRFTYLLTYSFPCQDLSIAGHQKGMAKGSGTRSGLLWEVERLLRECGDNLPQILVMENVKQVISKKNKPDFDMWRESLSGMGYQSAYQVLNAKDYGVPQNRERCFMVSWLGDYTYEFPKPIPLTKRLRDYLESEVDEKFFLTDEQVSTFVAKTEEHKAKGNGFAFEPIDAYGEADTHIPQKRFSLNNEIGSQATISKIGNITSMATGKEHQWGNVYGKDGIAPTQCSRDWKTPTLIGED